MKTKTTLTTTITAKEIAKKFKLKGKLISFGVATRQEFNEIGEKVLVMKLNLEDEK